VSNGNGNGARGRLAALRLVGFKSFADRTLIEFGPGISAVIGPNGSGKSNLADALRWTLGEQGRLLRTRRAEDVIFAGSSARRAIGMADVTLVIDNSDRLLPVDYGEVELGRRLYRSGENEYLLNRQRVRLRDLVELLDAGNLADNAFLFIGQGMVDQALALRPEERRPLFEEAAGVRRHERRRRQAENELAEAEANLERLRDLLSELRPQARRLAAQAEQLEARRSAGAELAEAVLAAARARLTSTSEAAQREQVELDRARAAADAALRELHIAETEAATVAAAISQQAEVERERRAALDAQRARLAELRIEGARVESEEAALVRQRARVTSERSAAEQRIDDARSALASPRPPGDPGIAAQLELVEQQLAEVESAPASDDATARAQRAAREAEVRAGRARVAELGTALADIEARLAQLEPRASQAASERAAALAALEQVLERTGQLTEQVDEARAAADRANAAAQLARQRSVDAEEGLVAARTELAGLEAAARAGRNEGLARAARARGAQLLGEGLEVEPRFATAVGAVLGGWAAAFVVDERAALALADRGGRLVLDDTGRRPGSATAAQARAVADAAATHGGGLLVDAVRRDPRGVVTRLLGETIWLPTLEMALALRGSLPAGWRAVTLAGEAVGDTGLLSLAGGETLLERARRRDELNGEVVKLQTKAEAARLESERLARELAETRRALGEAERELGGERRRWRVADDAERSAHRHHDQLERETNWLRARVESASSELAAAEQLLASTETDLPNAGSNGPAKASVGGDEKLGERNAALEERREELRRTQAAANSAIERWHEERRRADIALKIDEARLVELVAEEHQLVELESALAGTRETMATTLAQHSLAEQELARELHELVTAAAGDRARLADAEKQAVGARERLRGAEQASRRLELAAIEHRLQLEQLREQLLVELAGIGSDGRQALLSAAGGSAVDGAPGEQDEGRGLEDALERLTTLWLAEPAAEAPPSANRLATLRRRFHELGAGNPYALEEYAEVSERLAGLETQRNDLEEAIRSTRELIASLSQLITDQFRRTFAALEDAFARRFNELFGGGEAQLSLTDPEDLSATGVEIHARPPGKKRQPLSMLSGGERALTAVCLLLAMLEVRPVPFCVLDEVDAALDEANVGRFSKALRGLAERTQFIVITHNRGTIEGADALYGVTLGEDAASRIVSLRLPDEEQVPAPEATPA
jgi:chromosome segregation protein